jgi:hypothetical protein
MRRHFIDNHTDVWIAACDDLNIEITAQEAQIAIAEYRKRPGRTKLDDVRLEYSKEAFVDALAKFIIAEDQVSI